MKTKLIVDNKEINVEPVSLVYCVDNKNVSELTISINDKEDRDYLFTQFIREKIKRAKKNG